MSIPFVTQFTRSDDSVRKTNVVKFEQPSQVKQSLSYAVTIKQIYDGYCKKGQLPLNGKKPIYDENFINYDNLVEAQNVVKEACDYFNGLPPEIRSNYGNSLEKFVNAIHSQDNFLVEKGVLKLSSSEVLEPFIPSQGQISTPTVETPIVEPVNTATTA